MTDYWPTFEVGLKTSALLAARSAYSEDYTGYGLQRFEAMQTGFEKIRRIEASLLMIAAQIIDEVTEQDVEKLWDTYEKIEGEI